MRHYEVVFLVHPDQSEQVPGMVERYKAFYRSQRRQNSPSWKIGVAVNWLTRLKIFIKRITS
jgi:ribosomal protein S6